MKDLTQGSIVRHISTMAPQIFAGMIMIMLCGLIDLYFVSGLGDAAIAAVGAAGNAGLVRRNLDRVEVSIRAGEEVSALSGFRIGECGQQRIGRSHHPVRVLDPSKCAAQRRDAHQTGGPHDQHEHRGGERGNNLPP